MNPNKISIADSKIRDNVEVHVSYDGVDEKATIDFKNPLVGVSGFEISSVEIPNISYNVPFEYYFETNLGFAFLPAGSYTSTTFASELQRVINLTSSSPYSIVYNAATKKITISNSEDFFIYNLNAADPYVQALFGYPRGFSPISQIGPFKEYTFPLTSDDTLVLNINVLVKILTTLTKNVNLSIGSGLLNVFTEVLPITNNYGVQNNFFKVKSKNIQFKSKYNVNNLDISFRDGFIGNILSLPWSMTIIFYF